MLLAQEFKAMHDQALQANNKGNYDKAYILITKSKPHTEEDSGNYFALLGNIYAGKSSRDTAEQMTRRAIKLFQKGNYVSALARCYNDFGNYLGEVNKTADALQAYQVAIKLFEQAHDTDKSSGALHNIGVIYSNQKDEVRCEEYLRKAIRLNIRSKNYRWLAKNYHKLATTFSALNQRDSAISYLQKSLVLTKKYNEPIAVAYCYESIGIQHANVDELALAQIYFDSALVIKLKLNQPYDLINIYGIIGEFNLMQKKYSAAKNITQKCMAIAQQEHAVKYIRESALQLYDIALLQKDWKSAYENYKLFREAGDSLYNEKLTKTLLDKEYKFNFEKKESQLKAEGEKQKLIAENEKKKQNIILLSVSVALLMAAIIGVLMFRSARNRKRANKLLSEKNEMILKQQQETEKQKQLVEEKQKEVIDSIKYARRIQRALITNEKYIERVLGELKTGK